MGWHGKTGGLLAAVFTIVLVLYLIYVQVSWNQTAPEANI